MATRASKTAYFINRSLNQIALIGEGVRFPSLHGTWVLVSEGVRPPWEVTELIGAMYPEWLKHEPQFATLLTDFDVEEFERDLQEREGFQQSGGESSGALEDPAKKSR